MKVVFQIFLFLFLGVQLSSCNQEPTLQKYFVNHQNDEGYVMVDLPASMFLSFNDELASADQEAIESVKKVSVLAYPLNGTNTANYETEVAILNKILSQEKYKLLMKIGNTTKGMRIAYLGEEKAIDEVVFFGNDGEKGFIVARVLGKKMNVGELMKLVGKLENGDIKLNLKQFEETLESLDEIES
ncbi:DUF4252 domain-containing protein [Mesonia sp. HuA40]|uniref:DUF4252 domain-containing protein n=1 Tax=Mesonia sp. HuA40 TaxID=2602761 RepID=UPI0011C907F3|nr:DUF4252 domain-containing protein [Mesonia sp. HuA40]TXK74209.1 DUF4252 domain-containing protein [Mesonia sp. HuA40]